MVQRLSLSPAMPPAHIRIPSSCAARFTEFVRQRQAGSRGRSWWCPLHWRRKLHLLGRDLLRQRRRRQARRQLHCRRIVLRRIGMGMGSSCGGCCGSGCCCCCCCCGGCGCGGTGYCGGCCDDGTACGSGGCVASSCCRQCCACIRSCCCCSWTSAVCSPEIRLLVAIHCANCGEIGWVLGESVGMLVCRDHVQLSASESAVATHGTVTNSVHQIDWAHAQQLRGVAGSAPPALGTHFVHSMASMPRTKEGGYIFRGSEC
eukprot:TRINITY_DN5576_c0_g1_i5.p1 TRINITY_DN5576_c0_g1~~TRINITY_DN5576_c0_g1_i5.p1  ORF type:complete len:260 (-),score=19.71 TRINITY_DN5576_c0_g1_i5:91-870(-)